MKYLVISIFLSTALFNICHAQQARKTDDALLLEYYQNQRFADALTYLKSIYTEPVTDSKELSRLAYTSAMAHLLPDAEGFYQRVYDKDTTNIAVLYNLASINQRRGNNNKAEIYFKKLVVIDTTNFEAYNRLAQINRDKSGGIKDEIYYFEKANKLNPVDADVAFDILGDQSPKAKKVLATAIAADPINIILQQELLRLNYIESKWSETVKTGEQLLLLGDSTVATLSKLGRAYYQTKNYTCGIAVLTKIPEANQTEIIAYFTAACYKMLKDQQQAIVYFKKAITLSISTGTATYYNEMADSYETQKQFIKAKENYQKALLYDDKPLTYYYLAAMFDTELKDKKSALKYYKKYIAAKPDKNQVTYINYSIARIAALKH
jgi:tetratricopeptide (TPR) repeat protein